MRAQRDPIGFVSQVEGDFGQIVLTVGILYMGIKFSALADKQIVSCLLWDKGVFSREYEWELIIFPGKDQMFEYSLIVCPNH